MKMVFMLLLFIASCLLSSSATQKDPRREEGRFGKSRFLPKVIEMLQTDDGNVNPGDNHNVPVGDGHRSRIPRPAVFPRQSQFGYPFERIHQRPGDARPGAHIEDDAEWNVGGSRLRYSYSLTKRDGFVISLDDDISITSIDCSIENVLILEIDDTSEAHEWENGDFVSIGSAWGCQQVDDKSVQEIRSIEGITFVDENTVVLSTRPSSFMEIFSEGRITFNYDPPQRQRRAPENGDLNSNTAAELLYSYEYTTETDVNWNYDPVSDIAEEPYMFLDIEYGVVCLDCFYHYGYSIEFVLEFDWWGIDQLKLVVNGDVKVSFGFGVSYHLEYDVSHVVNIKNFTEITTIPLYTAFVDLELTLEYGIDLPISLSGYFEGYIRGPAVTFEADMMVGFDYQEDTGLVDYFDSSSDFTYEGPAFGLSSASAAVEVGLRLKLGFAFSALAEVLAFRVEVGATPSIIADINYPGDNRACREITGESGDEIPISSVDHSSGATGKYFNFLADDLDAIIGRTNWDSELLAVHQLRDGVELTSLPRVIKVWRSSNGGSTGSAHGRFDPSAEEGEWETEDSLIIRNGDTITVLGIDHSSETVGKYFNFMAESLDALLGRTDWNSEILDIKQLRGNRELSSQPTAVKVWRSVNGGSTGTAHGRFDPSSAEGDWEVGDILTFDDGSLDEYLSYDLNGELAVHIDVPFLLAVYILGYGYYEFGEGIFPFLPYEFVLIPKFPLECDLCTGCYHIGNLELVTAPFVETSYCSFSGEHEFVDTLSIECTEMLSGIRYEVGCDDSDSFEVYIGTDSACDDSDTSEYQLICEDGEEGCCGAVEVDPFASRHCLMVECTNWFADCELSVEGNWIHLTDA